MFKRIVLFLIYLCIIVGMVFHISKSVGKLNDYDNPVRVTQGKEIDGNLEGRIIELPFDYITFQNGSAGNMVKTEAFYLCKISGGEDYCFVSRPEMDGKAWEPIGAYIANHCKALNYRPEKETVLIGEVVRADETCRKMFTNSTVANYDNGTVWATYNTLDNTNTEYFVRYFERESEESFLWIEIAILAVFVLLLGTSVIRTVKAIKE